MDLAELGRKTGNEKIICRHRKTRYKANTRKKFFDDQPEGIFPTDSERVSLDLLRILRRRACDGYPRNPFRVERILWLGVPGLSRFALQPWAGVSERLRR